MVLLGGREEARCQEKKDVAEIGRDIAVRMKRVFVIEDGESVQEPHGV